MNDFFPRAWSRLLMGKWSCRESSSATDESAGVTKADAPSLKPRAVVLVHGIHDTARSMEPMAQWLRGRGWEAYTLSLRPNNGSAGLEVLAKQLAQFIEDTLLPETKVDLVGFSMGGLVSRYYLQRLGGMNRVERFVTISSPHHGSWWAYLHNGAGGVQMRPRSAFLQDLNNDGRWLEQVRVTSLWTPLDLMIVPARSSRLAGAFEGRHWVLAHPLMVLQKRVLLQVERALK